MATKKSTVTRLSRAESPGMNVFAGPSSSSQALPPLPVGAEKITVSMRSHGIPDDALGKVTWQHQAENTLLEKIEGKIIREPKGVKCVFSREDKDL